MTVPQQIETQSGGVVRYMKRERQAFEFDNTKIMQREMKIITRAEVWMSCGILWLSHQVDLHLVNHRIMRGVRERVLRMKRKNVSVNSNLAGKIW